MRECADTSERCPYAYHPTFFVGADAHIGPLRTGIIAGKRGDVGIAPYVFSPLFLHEQVVDKSVESVDNFCEKI